MKPNNVGRTITNFYCDGFFGRDYDLDNSMIEGEGEDWIVVRKMGGEPAYAYFGDWDKQELIDEWCA